MYLQVCNLKKSYGFGENVSLILKGVSFGVEKGEICVILGSSGCGKSTMLNCIGGLETIDEGSVTVDGLDVATLDRKKLSKYRRDYLGFIFQNYNLIPNLTVQENIELCKYLTKEPINIDEVIDLLGLTKHKDKFPYVLSGGQQQRCAIARAIVKNPRLLLCDEPTGALDSKTAKEILCLLEEINKKYNTTILMVTHNLAIQNTAHKVIVMQDGMIKEIRQNTNRIPAAEIEGL